MLTPRGKKRQQAGQDDVDKDVKDINDLMTEVLATPPVLPDRLPQPFINATYWICGYNKLPAIFRSGRVFKTSNPKVLWFACTLDGPLTEGPNLRYFDSPEGALMALKEKEARKP
jgi:hypothetical protein